MSPMHYGTRRDTSCHVSSRFKYLKLGPRSTPVDHNFYIDRDAAL
jgi:hypothetical protein